MRDVSHFWRTYVDIYRICAWPVSHLPHKIQLFQCPVRDVSPSRRTYIEFYRICACPGSTLPRIINWLPFRIALYMQSRFSLVQTSLCAGFAPIAFSTLVSYRAGRCLRTSTSRISLCASRVRQTQNRMLIIDTSRVIRSFLAAALKRDNCRLFAWLLSRLPHVIHVFSDFRPSDDFVFFLNRRSRSRHPRFDEFVLSFDTFAKNETDTVYLLLCDLNLKI